MHALAASCGEELRARTGIAPLDQYLSHYLFTPKYVTNEMLEGDHKFSRRRWGRLENKGLGAGILSILRIPCVRRQLSSTVTYKT